MLTRRAFAVLLLMAAAGQAGCSSAGWSTVKGSQSLERDHLAASPLRAETVNGSITIKGGHGDLVAISADIRARSAERLQLVELRAERQDDGVLKVWIDWPDGSRLSNEGASLTILLPDVQDLTAKTSNGSIRVESASGDADLTTSNGSITVTNQDGAVRAASSNASITITSPVGEVDLSTSNGRIQVSDAHAGVKARSSNGSITVALEPDAAGPVDLATSNGSVRLTVGAAFAGELGLSTSNGRISLPSSGATIVSQSRSRATLRFGAPADAQSDSRVATSNGSITIEYR
ncbi:MAG: DUF4097 domain-containing protein [Phycisphaerales bacterium]